MTGNRLTTGPAVNDEPHFAITCRRQAFEPWLRQLSHLDLGAESHASQRAQVALV
jgi:hypothetical protein